MSESLSKLIRTADPQHPSTPHHKISGTAPPVRIFQREWMEAFTFISLRTFLIFCFLFWCSIGYVVVCYSKSVENTLLSFLLGLPVWILTEYFLHRFIFHFSSENKTIQHLVYVFHGNHHIQPNHPYRTLMPVIVTLPVGLFIWALFIEATNIPIGSALFWGFFTGYACYDCLHYATHNFKMKRFPFSLWKRHHLLHHYMAEEHNYAITAPWLDRVFRTQYKPLREKK